MSSMNGQLREIIHQKIVDSLSTPVPPFTRRDLHIPAVPGKALAVIGTRRTGKTTFLWQVLSDRLNQGTPREGLLLFSFEDERLAGMTAADLSLMVEEYYRLNPEWRDRKRAVFFLDEIQVVPGWEMFARRLLDTENVDLFFSGSSARLLSREVATSMRGRAMEVLVLPFSFREFLRHHGQEPTGSVEDLPKSKRSTLESNLHDYLVNGGFPEAQGTGTRDRVELLRGYVDVVLLRDVIERHQVSHPTALRWMTRQLLGNAAGTFSVNKFHRSLRSQGISVGKDTLHNYLSYLEDAFLVRIVSIATDSERQRMVNPRKVYPVDMGLIPIFDRSTKSNIGHALETAVYLELERRGAEVSYVRSASAGYEVDFLARHPDGHTALIQVCVSLEDPDVLQREVRSLIDAAARYPRASLHIITLNRGAREDVPHKIHVHSAVAWLLSEHA